MNNRLTELQSWLLSVAVANRDDAHAVMVQIYTVGVTGRRDVLDETFRDETRAVTASSTTYWTYYNLDRLINEAVNSARSRLTDRAARGLCTTSKFDLDDRRRDAQQVHDNSVSCRK